MMDGNLTGFIVFLLVPIIFAGLLLTSSIVQVVILRNVAARLTRIEALLNDVSASNA